jgi:hypothetical protein
MSSRKKIKSKPKARSKKIDAGDRPKTTLQNLEYPVFCFRHMKSPYSIDDCDHDDQRALIKKLCTLSSMTWAQIRASGRHSLGYEKIDNLNVTKPISVSDDVQLIAFRFSGMKPMVGYRNEFIFHILFLDHDYTVYNH